MTHKVNYFRDIHSKENPMLVIVDRIEGQLAVIEFPDRTTKDMPLNELPKDLKPGDCFLYSDGLFVAAPEETLKRKDKMNKLMKSMWNDQ